MNPLDAACERLLVAKEAERKATAARFEAEAAVLAIAGHKPEGTTTHKGDYFKVMTTGVVYRKVDEAALGAVAQLLPQNIFEQVFRYKPEIITAGVRYLQLNEPDLYAVAAKAITATPGKPRVEVAVIERAAMQAAA